MLVGDLVTEQVRSGGGCSTFISSPLMLVGDLVTEQVRSFVWIELLFGAFECISVLLVAVVR